MKKTGIRIILFLIIITVVALSGCLSSPSTSTNTTVSVPVTTASVPSVSPNSSITPSSGAEGMIAPSGANAPDTSSIKQKWLDVPYANLSPSEKLDIYLPNEGTGPFPVILVVHGGRFETGDKADAQLSPMLQGLNRSYAVVSVNYRLSSEAQFPAQIHDVKAALRFVRAHATEYNLQPDAIAAWGRSAGGTLVSLTGTSRDIPELEDLEMGNSNQSSKVQAVVDWCGPINFSSMDEQFTASNLGQANHNGADSAESKLFGVSIALIPEKVKKADPETYITPDDPPFFIQHGTIDTQVPSQQSVEFATKLEQVLGKDNVSLELIQGAGHADAMFSTTENVNKVLDFLDKTIGTSK